MCALWEVPGSVTREPPRGNDRVATCRQRAACTLHGRGRGDPGSLPLSARRCTHGQRPVYRARPGRHIHSGGKQANGCPGRRWGTGGWGVQKRPQQCWAWPHGAGKRPDPTATCPGTVHGFDLHGCYEGDKGPTGLSRDSGPHVHSAERGPWTARVRSCGTAGPGGAGTAAEQDRAAAPSARGPDGQRLVSMPAAFQALNTASSGPHGDPARRVLLLSPLCKRGNRGTESVRSPRGLAAKRGGAGPRGRICPEPEL